jgi:hypothetical protein
MANQRYAVADLSYLTEGSPSIERPMPLLTTEITFPHDKDDLTGWGSHLLMIIKKRHQNVSGSVFYGYQFYDNNTATNPKA